MGTELSRHVGFQFSVVGRPNVGSALGASIAGGLAWRVRSPGGQCAMITGCHDFLILNDAVVRLGLAAVLLVGPFVNHNW